MATQTVTTGIDTWVGSAAPTTKHGSDAYLHVRSGVDYGFIYFAIPAPAGATIVSAKLRLRARGASTGSRTVTAQRAASSWGNTATWNNKPDVTGTARTASIGTLATGDLVEIDVTADVQTMLSGSNYGWRITTSAATRHSFHSLGATTATLRPSLYVEWTTAPAKPTNLRPGNGNVISDTKPVLQFDAATAITHVNVQVSPTQNGVTPTLDTGWVASTAPELDLKTTAYGGLTSGSTSWRVRYRASDGQETDWSEWSTFSRAAKGTVTITNPAAATVDDSTPPITWTFSATQVAYEVQIVNNTTGVILHDSGRITSTEQDYTPPVAVMTSATTPYRIIVLVWDNVAGRVNGVSDPAYAWTDRTVTVTSSGSVVNVTNVNAIQRGSTPWVDITWSRSAMPDSFQIERDDEVIADNLDPVELNTGTTNYAWTDYSAPPFAGHTYRIRAKVNGQRATGVTDTVTTSIQGIWIADTTNDVWVALGGSDAGTWTMTEDAAVYTPVGSTKSVRIISGMRGLEGSLNAVLVDGWDKTLDEMLDDLYWIKERPTGTYRLVLADVNIPALIGNVTVSPVPSTKNGQITRSVSFSFWQSGEVPFQPVI